MSLENFFRPKSVAVIGASREKGKVGHEILANLVRGGYAGKIFPVNPTAPEIGGVKCFADLNSIGEVPELVIIVVPAKGVPGIGEKTAMKLVAQYGTLDNLLAHGEVWQGVPLHDHVLPVLGFGMAALLSIVPFLLQLPGSNAAPADVAAITVAMSGLFTVSTVTLLACLSVDILTFPPKHGGVAGLVLEIAKMWALLPVAGLALGVAPALDAQTKLALGLPLEWRVTPKSLLTGSSATGASVTGPEL